MWVRKIVLNELDQSQINSDVQLLRIQHHILKMKQRNFKAISYHGKMRVEDVKMLEELRQHNRDIVLEKKGRREIIRG